MVILYETDCKIKCNRLRDKKENRLMRKSTSSNFNINITKQTSTEYNLYYDYYFQVSLSWVMFICHTSL